MSTLTFDTMTGGLTWADLRQEKMGASIIGWMWKTILALRAHRNFRRAHAELMALDDGALKDIGLHRCEIDSVLTDKFKERRTARNHLGVTAARLRAEDSRRQL